MTKTIPQRSAHTRRAAERLGICLPLSIHVPGLGSGLKEQVQTLNISRGGVSFTGHRHYRPGMKVGLYFPSIKTFNGEIPAQVVRVSNRITDNGTTVAAHFEDASLATLFLTECLAIQMRISLALLDVIRCLSPGVGVKGTVESICYATERALDAERVLLFLGHKKHPELLFARTQHEGKTALFKIRVGAGLLGKAAEANHLMNVRTPSRDPLYLAESDQPLDDNSRSALCISLNKDNHNSPGLIVILNKRHGPFTTEDEQIGSAIANQISILLREAYLFESVRNINNLNQGILESIATGVLTYNSLGNVTTLNPAAADIFGLQPDTHLGKRISQLLDPVANPRICSLTESVLATRRRRAGYDIRFLRSDGKSLSLNVTSLPLQDAAGRFVGGVLVAEDITQEQRMMSTLYRYMAREVVDQILQDKGKSKLGGTRTEVTILIADIRNFTSLSDQMDPMEIMELLNLYFPRMINVIFRHQGMVDKLIGDALLAVFGVPVHREDDALRAARAAIEMRKELSMLNKELARRKRPPLEIGIGITSGIVICGNVGSERRMDYTVIGDPVNLAVRLEGLTKKVERKILVSETVRNAINGNVGCESLGLFKIKGKLEKIPIFAVASEE